jgi:hypothetical protein
MGVNPDLESMSSLLIISCILQGVRYSKYVNTEVHKALYEHLRNILASVLLISPLPMEALYALAVASNWNMAPDVSCIVHPICFKHLLDIGIEIGRIRGLLASKRSLCPTGNADDQFHGNPRQYQDRKFKHKHSSRTQTMDHILPNSSIVSSCAKFRHLFD